MDLCSEFLKQDYLPTVPPFDWNGRIELETPMLIEQVGGSSEILLEGMGRN